MADLVGQAIGNYRLVRFLGRGSFADVYLGEHRYLKNYAALKLLRISLTDKEASRFLSEAQILRRLTHPHIVRVLDFSVERGTPVLIMDYASGGTARQRHPAGSSLSLAKTVDYVKQVAAALQYAHTNNLIHRDVKPDNILFDQRQQLLLSDFGLALFTPAPELLSTQDMAGTVPYTAPEQLRGRPTFASDQYALAVITYEWLCGRRPFEGNQWMIIQQHLSTPPPPLRETCPELPEGVEAVVLRALAKNPQERFVSMQAFALALERASQEHEVDSDEDVEITVSLQPVWHPLPALPASRIPSDTVSYLPQGIFLAASPADEVFAKRLKTDLQARGITVWNERFKDTSEVVTLEDGQRQEIRAAQVVLVVVSPYTRTSRVAREQMRIAEMYRRELLFVWAAGEEKAEVMPDLGWRTTEIDLFDARGNGYEQALDEIAGHLEDAKMATATAPMETDFTEIEGEPRNPYKGLRAFTQKDSTDFFGREALIQDIVESIKRMLSTVHPDAPMARLLTALGASGSGKSSLVMAGLLPQLKRDALPGSEHWVYMEPMVPGTHPLQALAQTLAPHLPKLSTQDIHTELQHDAARGLHELTTQMEKPAGANVVLVLDQFEELFTQTISEQERQHLIDLLMTAVTAPKGPLIVLLTLRADFYDRPLAYPELGRLIEQQHSVVLPMSIEELRAVIEQPAALPDVLLTFEGHLVGDLLFEAQGQAGALPLLEFTLDQLFQQRDGHWLTLQAYRKIGGVKGALAKHAEFTYQALPSEEHRRLARALFLRLIETGMSEHDSTRRRAALSELVLPDARQSIILREVADAFVDARLLITNEIGGTTTIEVSHEALIREWGRFTGWVLETREDLALQKAIYADAAEWIRREKPADRLYRGDQLTEGQAWAKRNVPNADEIAFLQASATEHQQREELELSRQAHELQLQRRVVSRQRLLISALSIFSVVVIILASFAGLNYLRAEDQTKLANRETLNAQNQALNAKSRALAANASSALAQNQLDLSLLLSVQGEKTLNTFEARNSLLYALQQSPHILTILRGEANAVTTVAFSHDGSMLLSSDGFIIFKWDTTSRNGTHVSLKGDPTMVGSTAMSPDNRTLLTSSANGVLLWDIQTGAPTPLAPAIPNSLSLGTTVAFSADGTLVASGRCSQPVISQGLPSCLATSISVWNVQATKAVGATIIVPADVKSIAFSPDGQSLISASHTGIQFWNRATGQALGPALANSGGATSFAFSPDGKTLAAGNEDTTVRLWDVASGAPHGTPFTGHTGPVLSVAFSPDGKSLAAASEDKTVILWNVATGQSTPFASYDGQPKTSVAFSPDGKTLASGNQDGTIILWSIEADSTITHRLTDIGGLESALFTPNGQMVLTGSEDGKVLLQDAKTGKLIDTLDTSSYPPLTPPNAAGNDLTAIQSLALSGTTVAAGRLDGTIIVWDLQTRKVLAMFKHPALLHKISLSSDGHMLASGGEGGTIQLWDVAKQAPLRSLHVDYRLPTLSVALSPDGTLLAAGNCGKQGTNGSCQQAQVLLWEAHTGKLIDHLAAGNLFDILDVAFSPDGHRLAASSDDGIRLWNVTTRKPIGSILSIAGGDASADYYSNILFSPNSTMLVSYSASGSPFDFVLWDVTHDELFAHPFSEDGSFQGSVAFSPDGRQLASVFDRSGEHIFLLSDITIPSWQDRACSIANRNLTQDEWNQFVKDGNRSKVCPGLPLA